MGSTKEIVCVDLVSRGMKVISMRIRRRVSRMGRGSLSDGFPPMGGKVLVASLRSSVMALEDILCRKETRRRPISS
jgi:hypothetical protein